MEPPAPAFTTVHLEGHQLSGRTFLLGNGGGFVLYLPVELNIANRTLVPIKWFGVSEFGRKYLEAARVWIEREGRRTLLNRADQFAFDQTLTEAVRSFHVEGVTVRQRFFVPPRQPACVMTLECDRPATFIVEPQFDMRYYQAFNTDFDGYNVDSVGQELDAALIVGNQIEGPNQTQMDFRCVIRCAGSPMSVEVLPEGERLQERTYLKDEQRQKLIHSIYRETHETAPDEAPIWDSYCNTVFVPAHLRVEAPASLVFAFDPDVKRAEKVAREVVADLHELSRDAEARGEALMDQAMFRCGDAEVDVAYRHVLSRLDSCLVARDVDVRSQDKTEHLTAIFAGNKYFLDAWKRDENICLGALMLTNDFETMRTILDNTWQSQDQRTGRLPHIIRLGEPLVYFSSDGTLWALRRLADYTRLTADTSLLEEKYGMVEQFFEASLGYVRRGLLPSGGVIQRSYLWETWEDTAFTPRDGYPVEIELLWLDALRCFLPTIGNHNPDLADRLQGTYREGMESFTEFHLDGYLADSLDYQFHPRERLTPNGYLAFLLDHPLPPDLARDMVLVARDQLAGRMGVKSLAPRDWPEQFSAAFVQDAHNIRDKSMMSVGIYNYHRGIEWPWLCPFLLLGELAVGDTQTGYDHYVRGQMRSSLHHSGVGGLDELQDLRGPLGADFQGWSMAGFLACLHDFAGVQVDALEHRIIVRPSIPRSWPHLLVRRRVKNCRFDVEYRPSSEDQRILVQAVDEVPAGFQLEIGIRVPEGAMVESIWLNDQECAPMGWRLQPMPAEAPQEAWMSTDFKSRTEVEFRFKRP